MHLLNWLVNGSPIGWHRVGLSLTLGSCLGAGVVLGTSAVTPPVNAFETPTSNRWLAPVSAKLASSAPVNSENIIQGNGVQMSLPNGFSGGDPTQSQTKILLKETARQFPNLAPFMKMIELDPSILRLIAFHEGSPAPAPTAAQVVIVARLSIPAGVSITDIHEKMVKAFPTLLPTSFQLVDHQVTRVADRQVARFTIDADIQGTSLREVLGIFKQGEAVYQVVYVVPKNAAPQTLSSFEQMIRTFKASDSARAGQST
jgi:hypothetical protein